MLGKVHDSIFEIVLVFKQSTETDRANKSCWVFLDFFSELSFHFRLYLLKNTAAGAEKLRP